MPGNPSGSPAGTDSASRELPRSASVSQSVASALASSVDSEVAVSVLVADSADCGVPDVQADVPRITLPARTTIRSVVGRDVNVMGFRLRVCRALSTEAIEQQLTLC